MRAAFALALVTSIAASAECKRDDFNRYIAAAVRLYEGLEYERALDQLTRAKDVSCGVDDDATLRMYEGIVRSDLGEGEKARAAFKEALLLQPDAPIPLKVSPKMRKQIEALRTEAKKELAPILARQEEERRKRIAEDNERELKRREEESRRSAETARSEELRRAAADEARRLEAERRAEEARRAQAQAEADAAKKAGRPEQRELTATPPPPQPGEEAARPVAVEATAERRVPVAPIVFAALGLVSGGISTYFGVTARQVGDAARLLTDDQVERERLVNRANTNALVANVLFGVTALLGVVALITLLAGSSGSAR